MPYQMFGCAWIGMFAGLLPKVRGRAEIILLATYAAVSGYFFGFMLNLSFWPFSLDPTSSIAYQPGLPALEQLHRYLTFFTVTSLGWDTGRAVTTAILVTLAGPAVLGAFRRAARRARFRAAPTFTTPAVDASAGALARTEHGDQSCRGSGPTTQPETPTHPLIP